MFPYCSFYRFDFRLKVYIKYYMYLEYLWPLLTYDLTTFDLTKKMTGAIIRVLLPKISWLSSVQLNIGCPLQCCIPLRVSAPSYTQSFKKEIKKKLLPFHPTLQVWTFLAPFVCRKFASSVSWGMLQVPGKEATHLPTANIKIDLQWWHHFTNRNVRIHWWVVVLHGFVLKGVGVRKWSEVEINNCSLKKLWRTGRAKRIDECQTFMACSFW